MQTTDQGGFIGRLVKLERAVEAIRKAAGLASAIISRGGLSLLQDSFIKMISSVGVQILYIGPDGSGRQVFQLRRASGAAVLTTYFTLAGQAWSLFDSGGDVIIADDADSGSGIARPSMAWPTRTVAFDNLPSTDSATFVPVVDTGFAYKLQPKLSVQIVHCATTPGTTGEVRVMLDGVQVGSTAAVAYAVAFNNLTAFTVPGTFMSQHTLELQCRRTAGTGRIGASMIVRGEQT